jgi:hypothetical protein
MALTDQKLVEIEENYIHESTPVTTLALVAEVRRLQDELAGARFGPNLSPLVPLLAENQRLREELEDYRKAA